MPTHPKVSVCIPVYNAGDFLRPAIASILAQDFKDFELIVVDDCSTQPTEAVVVEFDDARLRFQRNSHNLGLVGNWNRCLELAQGEYVTVFHQDDIMRPSNLSRKVSTLDINSTVGYVYSNIQQIDETGQVIGGHWLPQPKVDLILPGQAIFKMVAAVGNPISCPSVVARAECYERLGTFDRRLSFAVDLEMWMRIAKHYDVGYLARSLVAQRVHPRQETSRFAGTGRDYLDVLRGLDIVSSSHLSPNYAGYVRRAYQSLARRAVRMARWKLGQGEIVNGLRYLAVVAMSLSRAYVCTSTRK